MSTTVGAGMPLGGYQSPSGRTAGLPLRGSVTNPRCLRAERAPPPCAPSSTMNAYACVSYGSFISAFGRPITSFRPSPSRSATDGGEAVHCSHIVCARVRPRARMPVVVAVLDGAGSASG